MTRWTPADLATLRHMAGVAPIAAIAAALGRSEEAVRHVARGLGVPLGPAACPDCGRGFASPRALAAHRAKAHDAPRKRPARRPHPVEAGAVGLLVSIIEQARLDAGGDVEAAMWLGEIAAGVRG